MWSADKATSAKKLVDSISGTFLHNNCQKATMADFDLISVAVVEETFEWP